MARKLSEQGQLAPTQLPKSPNESFWLEAQLNKGESAIAEKH